MKYQQLKYFQVVAGLNNMNKAAEALHTTQPVLSKSIRALEDELHIKLFDRQGRKIALNANGRAILPHVNNIIEEYEFIYQIAESHTSRKVVKILVKAADQIMTDMVFSLNMEMSDVLVRVSHYNDITDADIIVTSGLEEYLGDAGSSVIREELLLAVPVSHLLADKEEVSLDEAAGYPTLILSNDMPLRNDSLYWYKQAGKKPKVVYECDTCAILREMIYNEKGISLVPSRTWIFDREDKIRKIHVSGMDCYRYVNIICRNQKSREARNVYQYIVKYFEKLR